MSSVLTLLEYLVLTVIVALSLRTVWRQLSPKPGGYGETPATAATAVPCKGCGSGCKK
jgi:hypothetical protein